MRQVLSKNGVEKMRKHYFILLTILVILGGLFLTSPVQADYSSPDEEVLLPPMLCPMRPGPFNFTQPNNYTFLADGYGDEFGVMCFFVVLDSEGYWLFHHPIRNIDGWWYLCYWNETQCSMTWTWPGPDVPDDMEGPQLIPRTFWCPLLISTGVRIGDPLPHKPFTLTQLNGRTFKAKLSGSIENPVWKTTSGKLIVQVPTANRGIWYYAEYTSAGYLQSTGIPVNEHGSEIEVLLNESPPPPPPPSQRTNQPSIPGFQMSLLLLLLPLIAISVKKFRKIH